MNEITTVDALIEHLNENPPEHYRPTRSFWETLWALDQPARLIYPVYTSARSQGKTAASKRARLRA